MLIWIILYFVFIFSVFILILKLFSLLLFLLILKVILVLKLNEKYNVGLATNWNKYNLFQLMFIFC